MNETLTRIRPGRGLLDLGFRDLWHHRELFYFLVLRDVKVRYKQTAFGAAWALLQPLLLMAVFSLIIGRLLNAPSADVPYPVFVYTGLVTWTLFSQALVGAANSLVDSPSLISKIYFPRLVLPAAAAASHLLDFLIASALLVAMLVAYGIRLSPRLLLVPFIGVMVVVTALSVGVALSAVNVRYRDVRYALPFVVQLWLFASPVAYPSTLIPEAWRLLVGFNPVTGLIETTRWAALGTELAMGPVVVSLAVTLCAAVGGLIYFRRADLAFADWV